MNLKNSGFTLIELVITITIVGVLSGVILFATTQYINKGKDSNISANLSILIPAGEVYYTNNGNSYGNGSFNGFCDVDESNVLKNSISQMPQRISASTNGDCWDSQKNASGVCCNVAEDGQSWAACAQEFTDPNSAWCVDSRGVKKQIPIGDCTALIESCH